MLRRAKQWRETIPHNVEIAIAMHSNRRSQARVGIYVTTCLFDSSSTLLSASFLSICFPKGSCALKFIFGLMCYVVLVAQPPSRPITQFIRIIQPAQIMFAHVAFERNTNVTATQTRHAQNVKRLTYLSHLISVPAVF